MIGNAIHKMAFQKNTTLSLMINSVLLINVDSTELKKFSNKFSFICKEL